MRAKTWAVLLFAVLPLAMVLPACNIANATSQCYNKCDPGYRFNSQYSVCCPEGYGVYCPNAGKCVNITSRCPGGETGYNSCPGRTDCSIGC